VKKLILLAFVSNLIAAPIFAQDGDVGGDLFRKGQTFIDLSYGGGTANSSAFSMDGEDPFVKLHGFTMLTAPNMQKNLLGLQELSMPEPEIQARNGRVEVEHAVTEWLGIGASINSSTITIKNVQIGGMFAFFSVLLDPYASSATPPGIFDMLVTMQGDLKYEPLNTLDFNVGFHLPGSARIDPFIKLAVGIGSVSGGSILKGGTILGVRMALAPHFHILLDGYANGFNIMSTSADSAGSTSVTETGAHFGIGTNF
jgi:hypothetical protein